MKIGFVYCGLGLVCCGIALSGLGFGLVNINADGQRQGHSSQRFYWRNQWNKKFTLPADIFRYFRFHRAHWCLGDCLILKTTVGLLLGNPPCGRICCRRTNYWIILHFRVRRTIKLLFLIDVRTATPRFSSLEIPHEKLQFYLTLMRGAMYRVGQNSKARQYSPNVRYSIIL